MTISTTIPWKRQHWQRDMGSIREQGEADTQIANILAKDGVFPNDHVFSTFLPRCRDAGGRIAFHEPESGLSVTFDQFVTDIIYQRHYLRNILAPYLNENGILKEALPIYVLSTANYEFSVASLAILALGGLIVPLPTDLNLEMLSDILRKSPTKLFLASQRHLIEAKRIQAETSERSLPLIEVLPIEIMHHCPSTLWDLLGTGLNSEVSIPESRAGITMFSSGSTGAPKGIVHSRAWFPKLPQAPADEAILVHRPPSWLGGCLFLFTAIMTTSRAEIVDPGATPRYTWERIRNDGITYINSGPGWWEQMVRYYKSELQTNSKKEEYLRGIRGVRSAFTGSSVAVPSLLQFLEREFDLRLQLTYGSTELGKLVLSTAPRETVLGDRCIGRQAIPDMPIKLSQGNKGELLVGGLRTFLGYLNGVPAIKGLFQQHGFFRTGDIAHREGGLYFFDGRISIDFIKNAGEKVPVLELEQIIRSLDYIMEAYVVPVNDDAIGIRLGVLVKSKGQNITLASLRADLAPRVGSHMLPNAFRLMKENERVPRTPSDKVSKNELVEVFFPNSAEKRYHGGVELLDIEIR